MSAGHADLATLLAYWLGELDEAGEAAIEGHYLGCDECSARLAEIEALATGVRRAFGAFHVAAVVTPAFADGLLARGLRVREYRVPRNGSVNCTLAPEDEVLVSRLAVPLAGVDRVDAYVSVGGSEGQVFHLEDVPFDAAASEVVLVPRIDRIRAMPAGREVVRLVAVAAGGERLLGEYTFNHSPYAL